MKSGIQMGACVLMLTGALCSPVHAKMAIRADGPAVTQPTPDPRLTCTDTASGTTVTVQNDGSTLVATDTNGKTLWTIKVTEKIRSVSIEGKAVRSIHGKHSYTDRDLATGTVTGEGAD